MTSTTMQIECPACAGQGGAGTYCEDCDCTGMVYVPEYVADELATVRELADMAQAALAAMTARAERAERLLEDLTPGGSEFHGSPARCAEFVRNRMAGVIEQVKLRQAAEASLREREGLLHLAYQVYRDGGGKVGSNSIFTFGEWLLWLPSQTDELLVPQEVQP